MPNEAEFHGATQEHLLAILAFSEQGKLVCSLVPLSLWGKFYRIAARPCYAYWQSYDTFPGEHFEEIVREEAGANEEVGDILDKIADTVAGLRAK
jgi:hypothetical protein